ncbi:hypothetical protein RchiOBHm_Chr3g0458591 [Rosa chinensis]|uniref:Uncharacterized protein n=1 Tax=Rosa chinensis TaxID=74649 RepID=A0A2P6R7V9_ROSCH|nr:hypothetical protein RchiOBHm_Chr3g0458591 [Rosa chinensis]
MGGNNRQKKSSLSFFSFFKSRRPRRGEEIEDSYLSARRVWPSVEDRGGRWVAEPGIDNKAADFIDRIHKNMAMVSESDCKTLTVNPAAGQD